MLSGFHLTCTRAYNRRNALLLAHASNLAYEQEPVIRNRVVREWGFGACRFFEKGDSQAFLGVADQYLLLAFRGTESRKDIVNDIDFFKVRIKDRAVHRGFLRAFDCIWPDIWDALQESGINSRPLIVTGHSLGAALATLAADRFLNMRNIHPLRAVYTFGSPRVGDRVFAEGYDYWLRSRTHRIVNNQDLVTRMPLAGMQFQHVGQMLFFDRLGKPHLRVSKTERLVNGMLDNLMDVVRPYNTIRRRYPDSIRDHFIEEYIRVLEADDDGSGM